ncbi:PKD domain-containing protein [Filimonas effusa]|nr:PKD domain-containing protein [Filimonas effusa]
MEKNCDGTGNEPNDMNMVLYLSAEEAADVVVTIDSSSLFPGSWYRKTFHIPANTVISTQVIPKGILDALNAVDANYDARLIANPPPVGTGGEQAFNKKGIHIVSLNNPIVAYAHIYGNVASGATMLMPVTAWGYNYTAMNSQQYDAPKSYSWMYVIAKENNTKVEIIPSVLTRLGKQPNVPFTVELEKGHIYQLVGDADCSTGNGVELTGTTVRSIAGRDGECHAVAVFCGSGRTMGEITECGVGGGRDNDIQQLFPEQAWGKRYFTAPFSTSGSASQFQTSVYKILVRDPATVVMKNGVQIPTSTLIKNKFYRFKSNTADVITADKPIMVGQFMGPSSSGCITGGDGDPEMVYLSPVEQSIKQIGFFRNTLQNINRNFVTLIVPDAGMQTLKIDGSSIFSHTYAHSAPGYTVVVKSWPAAQAQCIVKCDEPFTGITYGLGGAESYAYNAGTYVNNLNGLADMHNVADESNGGSNSHAFTCNGSEVELSILVRYQLTKMVWKIGDLGTKIFPNLDVTIDPASAVYKGTVTKLGVTYHKYTLPQNYTFTQAGLHYVRVLCTSPSLTENCNNTEEFYLGFEVKPTPVADFTYTNPTNCIRDITSFTGPAATDLSNVQKWEWTFPGPGGSTVTESGKDVNHSLDVGANTVKLKVVSEEGCVASVSKQINLLAPPVATLTANPTAICEGASAVFTPAASYGGSAPVNRYYWKLADGTEKLLTTPDPQTSVFNDAANPIVRMAAGVSEKCMSDTVDKAITVYSKPKVVITYPEGCLPANGQVVFTNTTSVPDAQTLVSHSWDFGDAAATPSNPNTSTEVSPSHLYTSFGNYNITYSVTTSQGCVENTVIKASFNVSPIVDFPATFASVCENVAAYSMAVATVTNGVSGAFAYSGPGVSSNGMFDPAIAGAGTHQVVATFTSSGNCVVSKTATVIVNASPVVGFAIPAGGCLPSDGQVTFDNTSSISTNEALSWSWNFGDAYASPGNENTSAAFEPVHKFADGTYNISLTATAASGCTATKTTATVLSVTPVVDYPSLAAVCENVAAFSIATATVNGSVVSGGAYSGAGVDASGSFNPASAGAGTHTVTYTYTTAGGCQGQDNSSITVYARPQVDFAVTASVCRGETIRITPGSPAGVAAWNWKFGNTNTSSANNNNAFNAPAPTTAGPYSIEAVTVNSQGCLSVPLTKTVEVHPLPVPSFTKPTKICFPGAAVFTNTSAVADNSTLTYRWDFGDASTTGITETNPAHEYKTIGSYQVKLAAKSSFGCEYTSVTQTVNDFHQRPSANFTMSASEICQGETVTFSDATTPAGSAVAWSWKVNGKDDGTGSPFVKNWKDAGNQVIALTVTNAIGCTAESAAKSLTVHLQPEIDAGRSFVVPEGTRIQFEAIANAQLLTLSWSPAAHLSDASVLRPFLTVTADETYTITATGDNNCTASDYLTVKMLKEVRVPNAFTPNNDRVNDRWEIPNLSEYPGSVVQIFNRYGQKVFESKGYSTPWDGRSNGKELPMGTYYYIISLGDGTAPMNGAVTIIR